MVKRVFEDGLKWNSDEERRGSKRYQRSDAELVFTTEQGDRNAVVLDESMGGIGVAVRDVMHLAVGQQVGLRYHGVPLHGCVKAIRREESGLFRVGIRWLDTRREASVSNATANHIQIAHYFSYIDMYLKCDVLEELGDNIAVKLWDGSTFEICVSRIRCRTIERRQTEIFEKGYANILAGLYELGEYETAGDLFDGVLNFEFSASQLITSA